MNSYKCPEVTPRTEKEEEVLRDKNILEMGCEMGFDTVAWLKRGVKVTATDLTPAAVDLTKRHFEFDGVEAEAVQIENALDLSFEDNTFDAICSIGVLHHTGDTRGRCARCTGC